MPGNDFEKQVQQKMAELNVVPSAAVWPEVEKQITERKKRRVIFIWLPLLILLLGSAGWFYMTGLQKNGAAKKIMLQQKAVASSDNNNSNDPLSTTKTKNKTSIAEPVATGTSKKITDSNNNITATDTKHNDKRESKTAVTRTAAEASIAATADQEIARSKNKIRKNDNVTGAAALIVRGNRTGTFNTVSDKTVLQKHRRYVNAQKSGAVHTMEDEQHEAASNDKREQLAAKESKAGKDKPAAAIINIDTAAVVAKTVVKDSVISKPVTDSNTVAKEKSASKKQQKILWGVTAAVGMSNIGQGFSGLFSGTRSYDPLAFTSTQNSSPGTVAGGFNNSSRPSAVKPGLTFSAAAFFSKPLGKNFSMAAGIGYSFYSTGIVTGAKIDTVTSLQYRTGSTFSYTNRFHFIEVPLSFEKQLGKRSRFSLNAGLVFSMLVSSNALQYDMQKSIYYTDNSAINKAQLALLAGFRYRLFQKAFVMDAGPQIDYGLSSIFKKELYGSRHLFAAGISTRFFFCNKKK